MEEDKEEPLPLLPSQPELWDADKLPDGAELLGITGGRNPKFTGEKIKEEVRNAIIKLRSAGLPLRTIEDVLGVSHHTISAVVNSNMEAVAAEKTRLANFLRGGGALVFESYLDDVIKGRAKPEGKPVAGGIMLDKAAMLAGEATTIIEHRKSGPKAGDLEDHLSKIPVIECETECIDSEPSQPTEPQEDTTSTK